MTRFSPVSHKLTLSVWQTALHSVHNRNLSPFAPHTASQPLAVSLQNSELPYLLEMSPTVFEDSLLPQNTNFIPKMKRAPRKKEIFTHKIFTPKIRYSARKSRIFNKTNKLKKPQTSVENHAFSFQNHHILH